MEIKVYQQNLKRVGVLDSFISLVWTRKYYEPGNFELHLPLYDDAIDLFKKGYLVSKSESIECGVIESIKITDNTKEKKIVIKGRFLSSYLDRRLVKNTVSFSGFAEVGMRELVAASTEIPNLFLGDLSGYEESITFQVSYKSLLDSLTKIAKTSGLGYRIRPDFISKKMFFDVYRGKNKVIGQSQNSVVVFSEDYDNLNKIEYSWNNQLQKTMAYIGGEGEGESRTIITVGNGTGIDLKEVFVDAKDVRSNDFASHALYLDALRQRGWEKLRSYEASESYEYETLPNASFIYKKDYDLGDLVTIQKKEWGVNESRRLSEVQEVYERGGMTVIPTLGNPINETVEWSL